MGAESGRHDGCVLPLIGVIGVLGTVALILKVTGVLAWPWVWILLPWWGPIALFVLAICVALIRA